MLESDELGLLPTMLVLGLLFCNSFGFLDVSSMLFFNFEFCSSVLRLSTHMTSVGTDGASGSNPPCINTFWPMIQEECLNRCTGKNLNQSDRSVSYISNNTLSLGCCVLPPITIMVVPQNWMECW